MKKDNYTGENLEHLGKGTIFPVDPSVPSLLQLYNMDLLIINAIKTANIRKFLDAFVKNENVDLSLNFGLLIGISTTSMPLPQT